MPRGSNSSTNASGHQGTGIGNHSPGWPHYNAPVGDSNGRPAFTRWDYGVANSAITEARAQRGSVSIACTRYTPNQTWTCGNRGCPANFQNCSIPNRNGCSGSRAGNHSCVSRYTWVGSPATRALYYDKSGGTTLVSFHNF